MIGVLHGRKYGIYLIDWEPAKLGRAEYEPEERKLTAELSCGKPFRLRFHAATPPVTLMIDDKLVPTQFTACGSNIYETEIKSAQHHVTILMAP